MAKTRILFCGTAEFAIPALESLLRNHAYELVGIVTQPDRAAGRHAELTPPPVKKFMQGKQLTIRIFQPEKLKLEAADILEETKPDLIIVAAYGQFIPKLMLDYPKLGCLNIHGSLLPQLRGAVPVQMAILQGLDKTGVTIQLMAEAMDAGELIAQESHLLTGTETAGELMKRLADVGANLLEKILPEWILGNLIPRAQDTEQATFCYQRDLAKPQAEITFQTPLKLAARMVRAFNPWPISWVTVDFRDQPTMLKIYQGVEVTETVSELPSKLEIRRMGKKLYLGLSDGWLELIELQLPGKQRLSAQDYLFLASNSSS